MTQQEQFGGAWTQEKLLRLKGYLEAYMQIFKGRDYFDTIYVDAFAGTGSIPLKSVSMETISALVPLDQEQQEFLSGSTRIALEITHPFKSYLFIEQSKRKCQELEKLKRLYPHISARINVKNAEANDFLMDWCRTSNWLKTRAVVFLDPFGMQVNWSLLEAIAATKSVDLWLLVPLGMGVNRMMTKDGVPSEEWAGRLTEFFGNAEWRVKFYGPKRQPGLFDEGSELEKNANFMALKVYFVDRLKSIFAGVAEEPLTLRNSKNSPLYLLCFAAGNAKGAGTAVKIAQHLLKE